MRRLTIPGLIVMTAVFLAGAVAEDPGGRFAAYLTGADVRPQVETDTEGRFSISFSEEETAARLFLIVDDGVGITEAHLHCHDSRRDDPIAVTLLGLIPEGEDIDRVLKPIRLDDEQIAAQNSPCEITNLRELREAIVRGRIYADVHSVAHPGGEIQGQVSFYRQDTDGDGIIDRHDPDIDGDGILNAQDDTPYTSASLVGSQDASGKKLFTESYTDIPWHQKLSTKDSNLIDIPIVMPFKAIPFKGENNKCKAADITAKEKARCMLQYGIINVMGMERTDTLYDPDKDTIPADCPDTKKDCVEVKLKVQRFHSNTTNSMGYEAEDIRNNPGEAKNTLGKPVKIVSLGYAITEATLFTPWLPWYTGHYCALAKDGVHDAVCYEDYFTTMIQATGKPGQAWLEEVPDIFVPHGKLKTIFENFCKAGLRSCDLKLGKVKWLKKDGGGWETDPKVITTFHPCGGLHPDMKDNNPDRTKEQCQQEVETRTDNLVTQFNTAITNTDYFFDDKHHYPWENTATDRAELQTAIQTNPFIGAYNLTWYAADKQGKEKEEDPTIYRSFFNGRPYVLPKQCVATNYSGAREGKINDINALKDCALDFEIHTNGFFEQWAPLFGSSSTLTQKAIQEIYDFSDSLINNQYGRTLFLFAGVPEQHIAVSFEMQGDMSIHDKVYGSSMYTQYLPLVNLADLSLKSKFYTDQYWHNLLMSNHMNQTVDHFIRGIRGRTLWHNEFRSHILYDVRNNENLPGNKIWDELGHVDFPAGFQTANHTSPFHGNTCDSCHIRNGSGIPLRPNRLLPQIHVDRGMSPGFPLHMDETYTNTSAPPLSEPKCDIRSPGHEDGVVRPGREGRGAMRRERSHGSLPSRRNIIRTR